MSTNILCKDRTIIPIVFPTKNSLKSVNFYLVKSSDTLTLIDAGFNDDECWELFQHVLSNNGLEILDLDRIILTHSHEDHIGLVNRILEKKDIPIYAHKESVPRLKRNKDFLSMRAEFFEQLYSEMGCGEGSKQYVERVKKRAISDDGFTVNGEIIPLTNTIMNFQVIETPGHAVDHVIFLDSERGWLFAGDLLLGRTSTNAIVEPDNNMNRLPTLVQYKESLIKCSTLEVNTTFPGHQNLIYNHKDLIDRRLLGIDEKAEKIVEHIKQGVTTANELAIIFYKDKYKSQFPLVMSEIIGHLDYLEVNKEIYSKLKNGIRHYYV